MVAWRLGLQFTVAYQSEKEDLHVCMMAKVNASQWIGLGFSGPTKPPHMGMNHSDIVVAHAGEPGGSPESSFTVLYSNATSGYPSGTPALKITRTTYEYADGVAKACFTRKLKDGHMPIETSSSVIWVREYCARSLAGRSFCALAQLLGCTRRRKGLMLAQACRIMALTVTMKPGRLRCTGATRLRLSSGRRSIKEATRADHTDCFSTLVPGIMCTV